MSLAYVAKPVVQHDIQHQPDPRHHDKGRAATGIGFRRRRMAGALLATSITATASVSPRRTTPTTARQRCRHNFKSLIPTPANTQRTDSPASVGNTSIHLHFLVNGRQATFWARTRPRSRVRAGWWPSRVQVAGRTGGATYTATRGNTYGVFSGGGSDSTTDVNARTWPSKPSNRNCGGGHRR